MAPRRDIDIARRFGLVVATRDMGPCAPRVPRPSPVTAARWTWRLDVCRRVPNGRKPPRLRLVRVAEGPPLKHALRLKGIRKVRGAWTW